MNHGTPNTYRRHKCRCPECVEANSRYYRDRRTALGRKRPGPVDDGIVDWVVVERLLRREMEWTEARPLERKAAAAHAFAHDWEDAYRYAEDYLSLRHTHIREIRADLRSWLAMAS